MTITIDKKKFQLKFGFKCFMLLGRNLGLKTFDEVVAQFEGFGESEAFELDKMHLIEQLVISAAEAHPQYHENNYSILDVAVLDHVMTNQNDLQEVIKNLVSSFPQAKQGNPQPSKRGQKKA